jgi:hypothetical protein
MYEGEYCILREETVRERRGSYSGFCCRLYPFICWIIIKEGPGNFSGGRSPHWVNHVNLCLSCIVCLLCFCFCICFILLLRGPVFLSQRCQLDLCGLILDLLHTTVYLHLPDPVIKFFCIYFTIIYGQLKFYIKF